MNVFSKRWLAPCLAALCVAVAAAQTDPAASASADAIVDASLKVLRQIDEGNADLMWDNAAPFIKTQISKQEFVDSARRARQTVGNVTGRDWSSVTRIRFLEGSINPPTGMYANVDFSTHLADGRTVFEKVSLRLEPNGWRWTGYVPRQQQ